MGSHDCWEVAEAVMTVTPRVLLRGKPGTGKTYHAVHAGLGEDQKVYTVTMTEETPAAELRGHYVPKGDEFVWTDGPAILAWREGARLVINEIDRSSEDVLSLMYAILDDPDFAELTLPTGEKVKPKKGFQVIATMNGVPDDLPDALQDRLPVDIEITDVNPEAIKRLPEDLREPAKNTALAKTSERGISIRMWLEFASLREKLPELLQDDEAGLSIAAQAIFGEKANQAMTALSISTDASAPHDMAGHELTEEDRQFVSYLKRVQTLITEETWSREDALKDISVSGRYREQTMVHDVRLNNNHDITFTRNDGVFVTIETLTQGV